jgi:hypothetical protein
MSSHDHHPDANARPLSDSERAQFEALITQVNRRDRLTARMRAGVGLGVVGLASASFVVVAVLTVACAVLASRSVPVAAGLWLVIVWLGLRWIDVWRGAITQVSHRASERTNTR